MLLLLGSYDYLTSKRFVEFNDPNVCKRQFEFLQDIAGCKCRAYTIVIDMNSVRLDTNLHFETKQQLFERIHGSIRPSTNICLGLESELQCLLHER